MVCRIGALRDGEQYSPLTLFCGFYMIFQKDIPFCQNIGFLGVFWKLFMNFSRMPRFGLFHHFTPSPGLLAFYVSYKET